MSLIPVIPDNAPFTAEQRTWLNGYLAGLFSFSEGNRSSSSIEKPQVPLLILFASQTGTAESLAQKTASIARSKGFLPTVTCTDQMPSLSEVSRCLLLTSTYGDGEPPDNAAAFWKLLSAPDAPRLNNLRYSVLALGDRNYPAFCKFGSDCDERLAQLGAARVFPRTDCDIDYEVAAKAWMEAALGALDAGNPIADSPSPSIALESPLPSGFSRNNPFPARLLSNRLLNAPESDREVRHYEILLAGSELTYQVGDALGVYPSNCHELVEDILALLCCDGEEATPGDAETPLRLAFLKKFDLQKPSQEFLAALAHHAPGSPVASLLAPEAAQQLRDYLFGRDLRDLLALSETAWRPEELVPLLKKLQPRLYSISSSPLAHPGEVHLTVAAVRYHAHNRNRKGVCSTFLADRVSPDGSVPVFVQPSHGFRLPSDSNVPVIMVGPGTGIAPFRAFLEEREATGATGRNWLFFGAQHQSTDFLYREQLESWSASGHLNRLSLAFSRDQVEKIYVQHRMLEQGADLWAWLQEGAHFYVCGDASRMAKDVDAALLSIAETHGGLPKEAATEYLQELRTRKRYQRDVY